MKKNGKHMVMFIVGGVILAIIIYFMMTRCPMFAKKATIHDVDFCDSDMSKERNINLPVSTFDKQSMKCGQDVYKLRKTKDSSDPGHMVYNIDPPAMNSKQSMNSNVYDCDGKADIGMKQIAMNCFPVSQETKDHRRV